MKHPIALAALCLSAAAGAIGLTTPAFAQAAGALTTVNNTLGLIPSAVAQTTNARSPTGAVRPIVRGAPIPLIAGGIPGALALGGAFLVIRRRRRQK
jgi:LPXTG-motif cell wall-anchored protein